MHNVWQESWWVFFESPNCLSVSLIQAFLMKRCGQVVALKTSVLISNYFYLKTVNAEFRGFQLISSKTVMAQSFLDPSLSGAS